MILFYVRANFDVIFVCLLCFGSRSNVTIVLNVPFASVAKNPFHRQKVTEKSQTPALDLTALSVTFL